MCHFQNSNYYDAQNHKNALNLPRKETIQGGVISRTNVMETCANQNWNTCQLKAFHYPN